MTTRPRPNPIQKFVNAVMRSLLCSPLHGVLPDDGSVNRADIRTALTRGLTVVRLRPA